MIDIWLYRRKTKALLLSEYEYSIDDWQENILDDICADARSLGLTPPDAAALFIEIACRALSQPLSAKSEEFVERMAFCVLGAMNAGRASSNNFGRAGRLYLIAKGAPIDRLDEVDELMVPLFKGMLTRMQSGLVYDGAAAMERLRELAIARGILGEPLTETP